MLEPGSSIPATTQHNTSLFNAVRQGDKKAFLQYLLDDNDCHVVDGHGQTLLHHAAAQGHEELVKLLLAVAPNQLEAIDHQGKTALHHAAEKGNDEAVELLLKAGAKVACQDQAKRLPIHWAAALGHPNCVKLLASQQTTLLEARDQEGKTPLHCSTAKGCLTVVQFLLTEKVWLEAKDNEGWTALHWAAANGHVEVVACLLAAGANDQALTKERQESQEKQTPDTLAETFNQHQCANIIRKYREKRKKDFDISRLGKHSIKKGNRGNRYAILEKVYRSEVADLQQQLGIEHKLSPEQQSIDYEKPKGHFGEILQACNIDTGQFVAVKIITAGIGEGEQQTIHLAEQEAQLQQTLEGQPYLMPAFDWLKETLPEGGTKLYQFMLFAGFGDGKALRRKLELYLHQELGAANPLLRFKILVYVAKCLLTGLKCLHELTIYHNDIKPDNLLIDQQGAVYLSDFGCSLQSSAPELGEQTNGDKKYFSPERIACCVNYDVETFNAIKADSWALGLTLWELLGLPHPVTTSQYVDLAADYFSKKFREMPAWQAAEADSLLDLIKKLLDLDPNKRLTPAEALQHPVFAEKSYVFKNEAERMAAFKCLKNLGAVTEKATLSQGASPFKPVQEGYITTDNEMISNDPQVISTTPSEQSPYHGSQQKLPEQDSANNQINSTLPLPSNPETISSEPQINLLAPALTQFSPIFTPTLKSPTMDEAKKKIHHINISNNTGGFINYQGQVDGSAVVDTVGPVHIGNITTSTVYHHSGSGMQAIKRVDLFKQQLGADFLSKHYLFTLEHSHDAINILLTSENTQSLKADLEKLKKVLITILSLHKAIETEIFKNRLTLEADDEQQQKIVALLQEANFNCKQVDKTAEKTNLKR